MPQITCPQCQGFIEAGSHFCRHCAFDLTKQNANSDNTVVTAQPQQRADTKPILLIAGVVCFMVILAIVIFIFKRKASSVDASSTSATTVTTIFKLSDKAQKVEEKIIKGEALSENDISDLSIDELRLLRNAHFAKYGRKYNGPGPLNDYLSSRPWYKPSDSYNDNMLNATDKNNITLILSLEQQANNEISSSNSTVVNNEPVSTPTPTNELSREAIMSLLRNRRDAITMSFDRSQNNTSGSENYERLMKERAINCKKIYPIKWGDQVDTSVYLYKECTPGPNGREFTMNNNSIQLVIGYKVPSQITGISKVDANTAYADVLMVFERTAGYNLYEKYQVIFNPYGTIRPNIQNESRRVLLRLYDDGWRVEQSR
jgi:hypothetical protein